MVRSFRKSKYLGDHSLIFLSDILRQSIGILRAEEKISDIFGTKIHYDTNLLSIAIPNKEVL